MNAKHPYTQTINGTVAERTAIVLALEAYRRTWQETAPNASLVDVVAPVGLVIADIAASLGLDRQERLSVLGEDLNSAVSAYVEEPIRLKQ
jgi:hypothetical protein